MTSRIIVNNIQSDTGVSTVTIASPVALSGGITGTGFSVGTGASISSPATNVLTVSTNNVERIRVGAAGSIGIGTNNPSRFIDIRQVGSAQTTSAFQISPHSAGWDILVTSGSITPHYQDNLILYSGQIGSGIERFRIDSSGYMTVPSQPAFRATRESGDVIITSAQRLPYNSKSISGGFDNTNSYNTTTFVYTAPVSGVYFFQASTYTELNTESMWDIRVNGNIRQRTELRQSAGDDIGDNTIINASCIVSLAANDQVDVYWASNSIQLIAGSGLISFSGCKIS